MNEIKLLDVPAAPELRPSVSAERDAIGSLLDVLLDALDFIDDQADVVDGPDGEPQANRAMTLAQEIRAVIAKATRRT